MAESANGNVLQQISAAMVSTVATAGQGVVRVNARRRLPATGIVWAQEQGNTIIVSANHVVERDEEITILTPDNRELAAELVGRDPESDLVVLRVADAALQPAARTPEDAVQVGAVVLALGYAQGLSATLGIISAVNGPWEGRRRRRFAQLISSDAPLLPGFSGGPLVDSAGRIVGLVSSHLGHGMTLAIPHQEIERVVAMLGKDGKIRRGYLGVGVQPVALPAAANANQGQERGLLVVAVEDGGPAAHSGLIIGDILVSLAGQSLQSLEDLRAAIAAAPIGQAVATQLLRGGQPTETTVTLEEAK